MKGIMFTAMLAMIALVVLSLATTYLVYSTRTNAALDRTIVFYTMTEEYNNIERMVSEVLALHNYSFDISRNTSTVNYLFPATAPSTRNALNGNISFLWKFLENISDFDAKIDLNYLNGTDNVRGNLSLRFFPEFTTLNSIGGIGSNRLEVRNASNAIAYDIFVDTDAGGTMEIFPNGGWTAGNEWPVVLIINGKTGSGIYLKDETGQTKPFTKTLSGNKNSTVNVSIDSKKYSVTFNVSSLSGDNRTLTVQKNGNINVRLRLTTSFNTSEMVEVWLGKETINMTVNQYYIKKSGYIRVG